MNYRTVSLYCIVIMMNCLRNTAAIAQLGERQTEDLKVPGSIPGRGIFVMSTLIFMY